MNTEEIVRYKYPKYIRYNAENEDKSQFRSELVRFDLITKISNDDDDIEMTIGKGNEFVKAFNKS